MQSPAHQARWIREKAVMIAAQLMSLNPLGRTPKYPTAATQRRAGRSGTLPIEEPPTVTAQFQPLDPGIVNDAIPAFFIGRNKEGFWVARDVNGKIGGIFLLENSALSFARKNSLPAGCATIFPSHGFELDLENSGNPLVAWLTSSMRLTTRPQRPLAAFIGRLTQAVKRRLQDLHVV
jgi:hypothetical protein